MTSRQVAAPRYSRSYRRLCQVAAAAGTARSAQVVRGLLPVAMVYGGGPWREPDDWIDAVEQLFGISLVESDVQAALDEAVAAKDVLYTSYARTYELSRSLEGATLERIEAGEALEREAQASWLSELTTAVADLTSEQLWSCLMNYSGRAFLRHGIDAVQVLAGDVEFVGEEDVVSSMAMLQKSMAEAGIQAERYADLATCVSKFFDGTCQSRVRYVAQLADSTFSFMALAVDEETKSRLRESVPRLTLFLDTNVILGVIGAHSQLLATASADLIRVISTSGLPFELFYHENTLLELETTIAKARDRVLSHRWSQSLSRAVLTAAPNAVTSLELRFHQQNADVSTPPDVFFGRYQHLPVLLAEYGLKIYREASNDLEARQRAELVAEYEEFVKRNASKERQRPYRALDHDIRVWQAAVKRQTPKAKSPLAAGAIFVSADFLFARFDRSVLMEEFGRNTQVVIRPDALFQAIRPFVSSSEDLEASFVKTFISPEFRGLGQGLDDVAGRVAAYLATYSEFPEETATRLLANSILMGRLREYNERDEKWAQIIEIGRAHV